MASRLAVIGDPIEHSKSPLLHGAAYEVLGLGWSYERIRVPRHRLNAFVNELDASWRGLSVTMPLKTEAHDVARWRDEASNLTGSTNTLVRPFPGSGSPEGFRGFNTDIAGIVNTLRMLQFSSLESATIVGSGATASSALVALSELGCPRASVVARDVARAQSLVDLGSRIGMSVSVYSLGDLATVPRSRVTVCSIPGSAGVDLSALERGDDDLLFDIAYDVWPSANALEWKRSGGIVASGLSMLAAQALIQVRLFVLGDPHTPVDREAAVWRAMCSSVGLDETGRQALSVG